MIADRPSAKLRAGMIEIVAISDRRLRPFELVWPILPAASQGGLTAFMVREKDLPGRPLLEITREAVRRCRPLGVRVIVNDRVDVALAAEADAVHLGVAALPVEVAKEMARGRLRVGASTHSMDELRRAAAAGADYATFGPVFDTPSKAAYAAPVGVAALREAAGGVAIPVLALGGITPASAPLLRGTGIAGIAAISAILASDDPASAVRALAAALVSAPGAPRKAKGLHEGDGRGEERG